MPAPRYAHTRHATQSCQLCGGSVWDRACDLADNRYAPRGPEYRVARCRNCSLHATLGVSLGAVAASYPDEYEAFETRPPEGRLLPRRRRRGLLPHVTRHRFSWVHQVDLPASARALDVGCGAGWNSRRLANETGWTVDGIEPSREAADHARSLHLDVHHGTLDTLPEDRRGYDLALYIHVLEHVAAPLAELRAVRERLRPGGALVVAVPNHASLERALFGRAWDGWDLPRHLHHFSPRTLMATMRRAGFVEPEIRFEPYTLATRSVANRLWPQVPYGERVGRLRLQRFERSWGKLLAALRTSSAIVSVCRAGAAESAPS